MTSTTCDLCSNPTHDSHGGEFYLCKEHWDIFIEACGFRGDGLPPFPMDPDEWWNEQCIDQAMLVVESS